MFRLAISLLLLVPLAAACMRGEPGIKLDDWNRMRYSNDTHVMPWRTETVNLVLTAEMETEMQIKQAYATLKQLQDTHFDAMPLFDALQRSEPKAEAAFAAKQDTLQKFIDAGFMLAIIAIAVYIWVNLACDIIRLCVLRRDGQGSTGSVWRTRQLLAEGVDPCP